MRIVDQLVAMQATEPLQCIDCGQPLTRKSGPGRSPKRCPEHRRQAARKRHMEWRARTRCPDHHHGTLTGAATYGCNCAKFMPAAQVTVRPNRRARPSGPPPTSVKSALIVRWLMQLASPVTCIWCTPSPCTPPMNIAEPHHDSCPRSRFSSTSHSARILRRRRTGVGTLVLSRPAARPLLIDTGRDRAALPSCCGRRRSAQLAGQQTGWRLVHVSESEMKHLDLQGDRVAYRDAGPARRCC
jgi:hypothetical protein